MNATIYQRLPTRLRQAFDDEAERLGYGLGGALAGQALQTLVALAERPAAVPDGTPPGTGDSAQDILLRHLRSANLALFSPEALALAETGDPSALAHRSVSPGPARAWVPGAAVMATVLGVAALGGLVSLFIASSENAAAARQGTAEVVNETDASPTGRPSGVPDAGNPPHTEDLAAAPPPVPTADAELVSAVVGHVEFGAETDSVMVDGTPVRLAYVIGNRAWIDRARQVLAVLTKDSGGTVRCEPVSGGYECRPTAGRGRLAASLLLSGASEVTDEAPPEYRDFEKQARAASRGLWKRG